MLTNLSGEINDTCDSQTEENNVHDSIIIVKVVVNVTLKFLSHSNERKMTVIMKNCQNCHASVCSKFSQLFFCQILFELVYNVTKSVKCYFVLLYIK